MSKTSVKGQVPAFAIRLVSDSAIAGIKKFPEIYNEIQKISLAFQYVKYKPKEAARKWAAQSLANAKYEVRWNNMARKRQWLKAWKMPTRETLWITNKMEQFKENYPKILIRKLDWSIDYIKNDWSWYLVTMINQSCLDTQSLWSNFFFNNPATNKATNKADIEERMFKKIKKILDRIEQIINSFKNWSDDIYRWNKWEIIRLAKSLTIDWLNADLQKKEAEKEEFELNKKLIFEWNDNLEESLDWIDFSKLSLDESEIKNNSRIENKKKSKKKLDLWLEMDWWEEV